MYIVDKIDVDSTSNFDNQIDADQVQQISNKIAKMTDMYKKNKIDTFTLIKMQNSHTQLHLLILHKSLMIKPMVLNHLNCKVEEILFAKECKVQCS